MLNSITKAVLAHKEIVVAAAVVTILVGGFSSPIPSAVAQISIDINDYLHVGVGGPGGIDINIPTGGFTGGFGSFLSGFFP